MKRKESDVPESRQYAGKVKRLALALANDGMPWEEALATIASAKGIPDTDKPGLGAWFMEHLPELEKASTPDRFRTIMENCACCKGGERARLARLIRDTHDTPEARLDALSRERIIIGCSLRRVNERVFRVQFDIDGREFYPCPCLRYGPGQQKEPMPISYCVCCGGHIKGHCETALGVKLKETVVSSALNSCGREPCVIELEMLDE